MRAASDGIRGTEGGGAGRADGTLAMPHLRESDGPARIGAEMITAELTRLTPQDFKAQLYAALVSMNYGYVPLPAPVDLNFRFLLPRVPIEWGQPRIEFTKLENATYCGLAIFDREDGGL